MPMPLWLKIEALRKQRRYVSSSRMSDRQKVCPKCRAFLQRKEVKCPYCGRPVTTSTGPKKRCRLCGGLDFKTIPVGDVTPGQKKIQKITICATCGKEN
jgi:hypothetical protein